MIDNRNELNEDFLAGALVRKMVTRSPVKLSTANCNDIILFRRILEIAITQGRWAGKFPQLS